MKPFASCGAAFLWAECHARGPISFRFVNWAGVVERYEWKGRG